MARDRRPGAGPSPDPPPESAEAVPVRADGLQIDEAPGFQEATWWTQRVGWGLMGLFLLLALLGALGGGPLSQARAGRAGVPLTVEYDRFLRAKSPARLTVEVSPEAAPGGVLRLWISRAFLRAVDIRRITPEPNRSEVGSDGLTMEFALRTAPDASTPAAIEIDYEPENGGRLACRLGPAGRAPLELTQWVYP